MPGGLKRCADLVNAAPAHPVYGGAPKPAGLYPRGCGGSLTAGVHGRGAAGNSHASGLPGGLPTASSPIGRL